MALATAVSQLPQGWDRDPRIVDPGVLRSDDAFHHSSTGTMVACYMVRGQWSDSALTVLHHSLAGVLPGRHSTRITNYAEIRVAIYLGVSPSLEATFDDPPPLEYERDLRHALACSAWALDRGVVALGRGRSRGTAEAPGLPLPTAEVLQRFAVADAALGGSWVPEGFPYERGTGGSWTSLRKTTPFDIRRQLYSW